MVEGRSDKAAGGRIRLGMVGGGEGAFIGAVHRLAARMDDHYAFVAGALSSTPEKAKRSGAALGLDPARAYPDFETMAREEGNTKVARKPRSANVRGHACARTASANRTPPRRVSDRRTDGRRGRREYAQQPPPPPPNTDADKRRPAKGGARAREGQ